MEENKYQSEDNISLKNIKELLVNISRGIFLFIDYLLAVFRKRLAYFIIFPLLGAALGYFYYWVTPLVYEQSMIVECSDLNKRTYYEIFQQLNELCKTHSKAALAQELKISAQAAQNISKIELRNLDGTTLEKDTTSRLRQPVKVMVLTLNVDSSQKLQSAILSAVNNNSYLLNKKETQKQIYLEKLKFIDKELAKLDSLKDEYTRSLNSTKISATFYNNAFNPAEVFVQSNNLVNQKEQIKMWLSEQYKPVNLIDGFKSVDRPKSIGMIKSIVMGFIIGLCLSLFIVTLLEVRFAVMK